MEKFQIKEKEIGIGISEELKFNKFIRKTEKISRDLENISETFKEIRKEILYQNKKRSLELQKEIIKIGRELKKDKNIPKEVIKKLQKREYEIKKKIIDLNQLIRRNE